ncbi:MAG: acetyl-CoA carboxylase carboxyl transferase subunit alpha [Chloroflexi bacterium]|nr:acetyl-CoA carboxylase carboxyl transferase subunit alpha [Chloroflexota bacterium]
MLGDDPTIMGGLARFENQPVVVIAQERKRGQAKERGAGPAGYHKAERLIRLAARLNLPIVTFVDTPGADPGFESERFGIAGAIAHCLAALLQTHVPTISIITGEGTSGGALALAATDRVLMLEHATYAVISPEGASAILYGDASHASEVARTMEMTVEDLARGIIDRVVPEPEGGAQRDVDAAAAMVKAELEATLTDLLAQSDDERLAARRKRYRS